MINDDDDDDEELRCQWMYIPPGQRVGLWSWWFGGLWRISLATSDASSFDEREVNLGFTWDSHGFLSMINSSNSVVSMINSRVNMINSRINMINID